MSGSWAHNIIQCTEYVIFEKFYWSLIHINSPLPRILRPRKINLKEKVFFFLIIQ